jgi:cysteine synthase
MKDRVALRRTPRFLRSSTSPSHVRVLIVILDAERQGLLYPHTDSRIFEGTIGSTGISIALIARARYGPRPCFFFPLSLPSTGDTIRVRRACWPRFRGSSITYGSRGLAIIMPDDVAAEKAQALRPLGADVRLVRPASIVDKKQVRTSEFVPLTNLLMVYLSMHFRSTW